MTFTELERERAGVLTLLAEANVVWIERRAAGKDRTKLDAEIAALVRKSRRLEEKIRNAEKRR